MGLFQAIHTAGSALTVHRTWMDAISDNIANVNTVRPFDQTPFQERLVVARSVDDVGTPGSPVPGDGIGTGTSVAGIAYGGDPQGRITYDPTHPYANAQGLVRYPDIDLGDQMVQMMTAQRAYQANLSVIDRARDAYQAALQIGK
jgi:flagellar basal-body rod protein FlgC